MKIAHVDRPVVNRMRAHKGVLERFNLLPAVVEALSSADVSCPFCSVKMISRTGLVCGLCPTCLEERCAKCGESVVLGDGSLVPGLTVGRGGSWKCAKCASSRPQRKSVKRTR